VGVREETKTKDTPLALALAPRGLTGRASAERDTSRSCVGRNGEHSAAGGDQLESSGQSRSSVHILRASQTSAQRPVIAAARVGEEDRVEPAPPEAGAEDKDEKERPLLGTLRGGILALARSAAFLARCVA
jgi:hypothetical protein